MMTIIGNRYFITAMIFCIFIQINLISCSYVYCIDKMAESIFLGRIKNCLNTQDIYNNKIWIEELSNLYNWWPGEYQRGAFEIYAFLYFMDPENPHRVKCNGDGDVTRNIDFEYVPILPLSWRTKINTNFECAVGGENCGDLKDKDNKCSMSSLARNMLEYAAVLDKKEENASKGTVNIQRFSVVSTYNFRTALGHGMPSQYRKSAEWHSMSKFTMDMMLGSYERISLCPDLLRKPFKHTVEIPYVPLVIADTNENIDKYSMIDIERINNFYFSGRIKLWGPERICTPRSILPSIALESNVLLVNDTLGSTRSPMNQQRNEEMKYSKFCLILKANSYSTGFFYSAIQAGCIPIVVSDWFFFAFPQTIDYSKFVIRIDEETFKKNPKDVLKVILIQYPGVKRNEMRKAMLPIAHQLSYNTKSSQKFIFDSMLEEMSSVNLAGKDGWAKVSGCKKNRPTACPPRTYVSPLRIPGLAETRSALCKNSARLFGYYKLVLYAQCTRIFWPLKPGNFRPEDRTLLNMDDMKLVWTFHNVSRTTSLNWKHSWTVYPPPEERALMKIQVLQEMKRGKQGNIIRPFFFDIE